MNNVNLKNAPTTHPLKRVLVTGATGFIGRHSLPKLVDAGFEVHALSRVNYDKKPSCSGVFWHTGDLFINGVVEKVISEVKPTHLLHFAWYADPNKYWTAPENFLCVQASLSLLQVFAEQGGKRVVMAGTCAEYDWRYGWCSESVTPLKSGTSYSACKNDLQNMLSIYSSQFGLSSAWGRIFHLYGPYEYCMRLVPSVISSISQGEAFFCSSGEQVRDFMYVTDVALAFTDLLSSDLLGPINIASGEGMSIKTVVKTIGDKLGRPELVNLNAHPSGLSNPPLLLADVRRLKDELHWSPTVDLDEGLDKTIAWWKARLQCS
jgi:nucleoside-diphosphate-sugar epimerase